MEDLDRVTSLDQLDALEAPIKEELVQLQSLQGLVAPDLSVLHGMINAIEAKRLYILNALAETENQTKLFNLWIQRRDRIQKKADAVIEKFRVLVPKYSNSTTGASSGAIGATGTPSDATDTTGPTEGSDGTTGATGTSAQLLPLAIAVDDVNTLENSLIKSAKGKEYIDEAQDWLNKARSEFKEEVHQEAQKKLDELKGTLNDEQPKKIVEKLRTEVDNKNKLIGEYNTIIVDVNNYNDQAEGTRNENLSLDDRQEKLHKLIEQVEGTLKDVENLKRHLQEPEPLIETPFDIDELRKKIESFFDSMQIESENLAQQKEQRKIEEERQKIVIQIQEAVKSVEESAIEGGAESIKGVNEQITRLRLVIVTIREQYTGKIDL